MQMIIFEEVVNLPKLFNLNSQSQILDNDFNVKLVNNHGLNM